MVYEVWARPPGLEYRVRVRVYPERLWQVACWTATVLELSGYADAVVRGVER